MKTTPPSSLQVLPADVLDVTRRVRDALTPLAGVADLLEAMPLPAGARQYVNVIRNAAEGVIRPIADLEAAVDESIATETAPRGPEPPVRVLLVDDSPDFLESAVEFIGSEPWLQVVGRGGTGLEAIERVAELAPDLVIMDVAMPGLNGIEATRVIKGRPHPPKILLVSMYDSVEHRRAAEDAGADGYVGKWEFAGAILPAIEALGTRAPAVMLDARAARLRTLAHLNQLISASLDIDEVLVAIARAAGELMEAPSASFWVADDAARTLQRRAASNPDIHRDNPLASVGYDETYIGEAARTRRVVLVADIARDGGFGPRRWHAAHGLTSGLAIPVVMQDQLLAVLAMSARRPFVLGPEEYDLLEAFAAQAAVALRNARLYDEARASRDFLRSIAENSADAIITTDLDARITYFSRAAEEMMGARAADLLGRDVREIEDCWVTTALPMRVLEAELRQGRAVRNHEAQIRSRDGRTIEVSASLAPLRDSAGAIVGSVTILRDVTDQKRTQETLLHTEKLTTMGALLAGVAHELNNPLGVLLGQSELLGMRAATLQDPGLTRTAQQIDRAAERCVRIVRSFLALARRRTPERTAVALNAVVQEAVELMAYPLRVDDVAVEMDLAPNLPFVSADAHQLHQVLINLIANAHQAMRGVPAPRRLRLATRAEEDRLVLELADSGPGIPPELRARVFEPFFTTKPAGEGTGLGLSLCHSIVAGHGGAMRVVEGPGGGAQFVIELPAVPAEPASPPDPFAGVVDPLRVLVVDDEAELAHLVIEMLRIDGHSGEVVTSGAAALHRLGQASFDLVLCDIRMPEMSGAAVLQEIRRVHPGLATRIVLMTGDLLDNHTADLIQQAAVSVLGKPFGLAELRQVIAQEPACHETPKEIRR